MILEDRDVESILTDINLLLINKNANDYMVGYCSEIIKLDGLISCGIYEYNNAGTITEIAPVSVVPTTGLDDKFDNVPGQKLVSEIVNNDEYYINSKNSSLFNEDKILLINGAGSLFAKSIKDEESKLIGFILYIGGDDSFDINLIRKVTGQHIRRIGVEIERLALRKQLVKARMDYRYLVETSRDMIWALDLKGNFIEVNRSAIMIYGYYPNEMKGMHYSKLMTIDAAEEYESYLQRSIQGNGIYDIVANHINKNGRPIQVIYNAKPKYSVNGELIGYTGTTTDITESVRAQIAIKNNSELFSAILSRLPVVFFRIDENGYLVDIRGQGLKRMGVDDMAWVGRPGYGLFVGMDKMIDSALSGKTVHFKSSGSYDGKTWWFYTSMFFDSWTGFGAVGFALDITDQIESEEKLVHLLKDNRNLAQRLVEVQEEERRNLSRELHDELGQSITAVKSLATAITAAAGDSYSEVRSLGNSIIDLSGRLYDVVNRLMHRLRPDILDSLGFEATINSCIANSHLERTGVKCNLEIVGEIDDLDEIVQITVYRIVQECLTNISKYAMASNIDIIIERKQSTLDNKGNEIQGNLLIIKVSDDGVGMDLEENTRSTQEEPKMGLQGMKERVTALGGEMFISSSPGSGVKIKAVIDLNNRPASHPGQETRDISVDKPSVIV